MHEPLVASSWSAFAAKPVATVTKPAAGVTRLAIRTALSKDPLLEGVAVELNYEVYDGYPAVRKWAVVRNGGSLWLKLERLVIDDLHLVSLTRKSLAAAMFGVQPSVVAFESPGARYGLIAASEIPSALRTISEQGAMGYTPSLFEWVLGPGEEFASEPVFYYGYSGPVTPHRLVGFHAARPRRWKGPTWNSCTGTSASPPTTRRCTARSG